MTTVRRLAVPAALTCACVLLPAVTGVAAAAAAEPERTGWWNRASAGGLVAPAPTTTAGDLRVAALGPDEPAAYAAVLYTAPGSAAATLELEVRSTTGTPEVTACPTETSEWTEGGNQPYDKAPPYDCDIGSAFGSLSADGRTLSFALDTATQVEPGVWSLALVPQPGSASGAFTLDVVEPGPEAFVAEPPETPSEGGFSTDTSSGEQSSTTSGGSGQAFLPGGFEAPPSFDTGAAQAPLVAGGAEVPLPAPATVPEPAVAAGAPAAMTPLIVARPAGVVEDLGSGRRLLALLVLAGGSAAVGYAAGQQRPGPRLIGGRSRAVVATAAPAFAGPATAEERPRGIGRFAKTRDAAPRRLR